MLAKPEINFRRTPVTLILTALALALEVVCTLDPEDPARRMGYYNYFKLGIDFPIWRGEYWRPFTTTVMHGGLLHAVFNMYWMTVFGPVVEHDFGSYRALGLIVLFAYVSSLAQFLLPIYLLGAEAAPMVGLSGVLYGLFGVCWMGSRHRTEYQLVCDPMTIQILLGWLFFCILLTNLGVLNVGNIAHISGLLIGVIVGQAIFDTARRALWIALATAIALLALASLVLPTFYVGLRP